MWLSEGQAVTYHRKERYRQSMQRVKLNIIKTLTLLFCALLLQGCTAGEEKTPEAGYGVYYLTQDESQISFEERPELSENSGISDYILELQKEPSDVKLKKTVGSDVMLIDYRNEDKGTILNFDDRYYDMSVEKEVLFRAAVVQTVLQDKSINFVFFEVNGEALKYANGEEVGSMSDFSFIDNAGDELSSYMKKNIRLYFADKGGSSLVQTKREIVYSSNEPLEKVVMEQLIAGPGENEGYATISPDTKLNTIAIKNGICYVSLDTALVDKPVDVTEETLLYSIVNSLTSVPGVNKVQISVNGETDRVLRSNVRLDEAYSFNEEIVSSD